MPLRSRRCLTRQTRTARTWRNMAQGNGHYTETKSRNERNSVVISDGGTAVRVKSKHTCGQALAPPTHCIPPCLIALHKRSSNFPRNRLSTQLTIEIPNQPHTRLSKQWHRLNKLVKSNHRHPYTYMEQSPSPLYLHRTITVTPIPT